MNCPIFSACINIPSLRILILVMYTDLILLYYIIQYFHNTRLVLEIIAELLISNFNILLNQKKILIRIIRIVN